MRTSICESRADFATGRKIFWLREKRPEMRAWVEGRPNVSNETWLFSLSGIVSWLVSEGGRKLESLMSELSRLSDLSLTCASGGLRLSNKASKRVNFCRLALSGTPKSLLEVRPSTYSW